MNEEGITESEFYQKYGKPVMVYNRFDGANFVNLIQDMQKSIHNEELYADLQRLIDLTNLATETHEMEYANDIYKILHDGLLPFEIWNRRCREVYAGWRRGSKVLWCTYCVSE